MKVKSLKSNKNMVALRSGYEKMLIIVFAFKVLRKPRLRSRMKTRRNNARTGVLQSLTRLHTRLVFLIVNPKMPMMSSSPQWVFLKSYGCLQYFSAVLPGSIVADVPLQSARLG